jgi:hypothetical protein
MIKRWWGFHIEWIHLSYLCARTLQYQTQKDSAGKTKKRPTATGVDKTMGKGINKGAVLLSENVEACTVAHNERVKS